MGLFSKRSTEPAEPTMVEVIDQGIIYEEDFIRTYGDLLKEADYLAMFGENTDQAKQIIDALIQESAAHKSTLELIKSKVG